MRDVIHVSLFDEIEELESPFGTPAGVDAPDSQKRKHFLGSVDIPFSTIYSNPEGKAEGMFRLRMSPANIGYEAARSSDLGPSLGGAGSSSEAGDLMREAETATYVNLAIFLRPPIAAPQSEQLPLFSSESHALVRYAQQWVSQVRSVTGREGRWSV